MSPLVAGLMRQNLSSFLAGFAPGALAAQGYTEVFAEDWASYDDTTELLAAHTFGSSSNSNIPRGAYLTKYNNDPTLPNRMLMHTLPFNNDWQAGSGTSAGRQFTRNFNFTANDHIWMEYLYRTQGTLHPTETYALDYSHDGDWPSGSADSRKLLFFEHTNGTNSRSGLGTINVNNAGIEFGWAAGGVTGTEAQITETGHTFFGNNFNWSEMYTGEHLYRVVFEWYRLPNLGNGVLIQRRFWQRMTGADGVTWDPQPPAFGGNVATRSGGASLATCSQVRWHDNVNNTIKRMNGSTLSWDEPHATVASFATSGNDLGDGLVYRGDDEAHYEGVDEFYGPFRVITGGDNKPFTDYRGTNLDDYGRADADWPVGA